METAIVNKKTVRKNKNIKAMQKKAKKYYGEKLFEKKNNEPKTKLRKFVDIEKIGYISMVEQEKKDLDINSITLEQLIESCDSHKITGRSGNGYLTSEKLKGFKSDNGTLLINAVECDPGLIHDAWIYRNKMTEIENGVKILKRCFNFKKIVLATKEPISAKSEVFEQVKVKDRYPMGFEKILVKTVLDVDLLSNEHPSDKGILVLNVQTVENIAELFSCNFNCEFRYITVADMELGKAVVVKAPINMKVCEIYKNTANKFEFGKEKNNLYVGSGAMSCHKAVCDESITGSTNYIATGSMPDYKNSGKCVKCGSCISNCPMGVSVGKIVQYIEKNGMTDASKCKEFHPDQCIGCETCTYVCHAGKNTREIVAWAKENINK